MRRIARFQREGLVSVVLDLSGSSSGAYIQWVASIYAGNPDGAHFTFSQTLALDGQTSVVGTINPAINAWHDSIIGTQGADTIYNAVPSNYIYGGSPDTYVIVPGSHIDGMGGDDTIGGAVVLDGGTGNDHLILYYAGVGIGGAGDDLLSSSAGVDNLDGGTGIDTVEYGSATTGVTVNLVAGTASDGDHLHNIENVIGTIYADTLIGNAGANSLSGGNGNDVLIGGAGADHLDGGAGIDRTDYSASAAGITVNLATNVNSGGDAAGDVLTGIETLGGTNFADTLTGGAGTTILWGHDGNDWLQGGGGITLYGEAGNDTLVATVGGATLIGGGGADLLYNNGGGATASYANATAGVTLDLVAGGTGGDAAGDSFSGIHSVIGSNFDDLVYGTNTDDTLSGLAGADRLYGGVGSDTLSGGAGDDTLYGGGYGFDRLDGGDGNDNLVIGNGGSGTMIGGAGIDIVNYAGSAQGVTVDLAIGFGSGGAAGTSYSGIENALGSAQADTLTGNAGANSLWGMDGNDVLIGGAGADALKGGTGADIFVYKSIADSTPAAAGRDTIGDFSHAEGDRIDLSQIDADGNAANGDTAFTFQAGVFTGVAHQLHVVSSGGVQIVEADLNGDRVADMAIVVVSATALNIGDFVL
jgi:Ca2+-binding RTX toxin-like protein